MIRVLFYGPLADSIAREVQVEGSNRLASLEDLRTELATQYPDHAGLITGARTRWVLDSEFAKDHVSLDGVALVECLPPVSGGL